MIREKIWCHAVQRAFSVFRELKEFVSSCELWNMRLLKYPSRASLGFAVEIAVKVNRNREGDRQKKYFHEADVELFQFSFC